MIDSLDLTKLSVTERLISIEKIWNSIDENQPTVTSAQKPELGRGLKRFPEGKTKFFSWQEVKRT